MNKWFLMLLAAAVASTAGAGAAAAAASPQAIRVTLDGELLNFPAAPQLIGGKTFVEFRTLFKALGYSVDYAASSKTVKAASSARKIEMKVGGSTALVNGSKVPVNGDLKLVGGRTMVGVRFIATLSAKKVEWNGQSRTVVISPSGPTDAERSEIFAVLHALSRAEAASDAEAYMAGFLPDAQGRAQLEAAIRAQFARVQIKTEYVYMKLITYTGSQAVISTTEDIRKAGGAAFFPDNRSVFDYHLRKDAKGQWKIDFVEQLSAEVLNMNELWKQEVQVPASDKQEVEALLSAQTAAINGKNYEAYATTYMPGVEGLDQEMADLKDMLAAAQTTVRVERSGVVEYSGGRAMLLVSMLLEIKDGADTLSGRTVIAIPAVKQEGKWLFSGIGEDLYMERI
jgi:ketosteroid isomerase-like protein